MSTAELLFAKEHALCVEIGMYSDYKISCNVNINHYTL